MNHYARLRFPSFLHPLFLSLSMFPAWLPVFRFNKNAYQNSKWANKNKQFSKKEIDMANNYFEKYPAFLVLKGVQIKVTLTYNLPQWEQLSSGDLTKQECWRGCEAVAVTGVMAAPLLACSPLHDGDEVSVLRGGQRLLTFFTGRWLSSLLQCTEVFIRPQTLP